MFQYPTEILLLTRSIHPEELYCWLIWHLNILHFDHVVLFDNESPIDVNSVISKFSKEKIEYYYIKGWPNQYKLYNDYLKSPKAQWIIALDDDEYLYLSDLYNSNIHSFIESLTESYKDINKFYILWTHLFSKNPIMEYTDLLINTHTYYSYNACTKIEPYFGMDNTLGKCLIKNTYSYTYEINSRSYGHIPICNNGNDTTILIRSGKSVYFDNVHEDNFTLYPHAFIAHYQFKNKKEWIKKCNTQVVNCKEFSLQCKLNSYNMLYSFSSSFRECILLKNNYNKYIGNH